MTSGSGRKTRIYVYINLYHTPNIKMNHHSFLV